MFGRKVFAVLAVTALIAALFTQVLLVSATPDKAEIGGFLLPFSDVSKFHLGPWGYDDGSTHDGIKAYDFVQDDNDETIPLLAPKSGVVLDARDDLDYVQYIVDNGSCGYGHPASMNYILLGHGGIQSDGEYDHYTVIYHLAHDSLTVSVGEWVEVGQQLADVGKVGFTSGIKHIHMSVHRDPPVRSGLHTFKTCSGTTVLENVTYPWDQGWRDNSKSFGFSEFDNAYEIDDTIFDNLPNSWNNQSLVSDNCNPKLSTTKVVLFEHIDYGGECVVVTDPSAGYYVPSARHISSIYLSPAWINSISNGYKTLTLWNSLQSDLAVISASVPNLISIGWNDRVAYVHNESHSNTPWLLEESYTYDAPFDANVHIKVSVDQDLVAWRVCFDGENCQENATPINELYYTWNTYGVADGNHIISVQYRRTSDNGNWSEADYYESNFYLNPNRQLFAPCSSNVDGAKLESGSDCVIVTANVPDLDVVDWADKSNLSITANGVDILAYDSPDFVGAPYYVPEGDTRSVGNNVSGIEIREPVSTSAYVPSDPLGVDANTVSYYPLDEGSGTQVYDYAGSLTGNLSGSASFTTGRFGSAVLAPTSPSVSGVNFGAVDFGSPLTVELFVKFNSTNNDQRIAAQLGGSPNTGNSKWMIGLVGGYIRVWACYPSGCHEGYSLNTVQSDTWYYLMFTYNGDTTAKLYVDSLYQTTLDMDGAMSSGATTFEIGKGENIYGCDCTLDDVRISNIVRVPVGPPAITPTPIPSSTPVPTITPTPTVTVTPTATPVPVYWDGGLVANGSFESLTGGWADSWMKDSGDVGVDTSNQGNSGANTLHFSPTSSNTHAFAGLVDVNPARTYQFSQFVITTSGTGEFGFYIDEYDSGSNWISGQWLGAASIDSSGTVSLAYTPSSGSVASAGIQYYMNANSTFNAYVDSVRFEENLISNGSFEVLDGGFADNWSKDAGTISIDQQDSGNDGANSLYFGYNAGNTHVFAAGVPVNSSTTYTLSQYVKATSGTGEFGYYIDEYDSSWNWVSGQWLGAEYGATNETISLSYTPSSGSVAYAAVQYYTSGGTNFDVYVDRVKLVVSP